MTRVVAVPVVRQPMPDEVLGPGTTTPTHLHLAAAGDGGGDISCAMGTRLCPREPPPPRGRCGACRSSATVSRPDGLQPAACPRWRVPLLVPRPDAPQGDPSLQQGPVHAEVLHQQQALPPRLAHHRPEESASPHAPADGSGPWQTPAGRRGCPGCSGRGTTGRAYRRSAVRRTGAPSALVPFQSEDDG